MKRLYQHNIRARFTSLAHHNEGAAIIEYAIVIPILLLLMIGIIEYSLVMYGTSVLDGATEEAARDGSTGYFNTGTGACGGATQTQTGYINCILQNRVSGLLNPAQLIITAKSFNADGVPYCTVPPCPPEDIGNPGDIVEYTVVYQWAIITPLLRNFLGNNGVFTITSNALVKNEPTNASGPAVIQ